MDNFFEELKKYFEQTPQEEILKVWEKSASVDDIGMTVEDFLANSTHYYPIFSTDPNTKCASQLMNNLDPKFTSGFFM
jgi:hypothetical protein